MRPSETGARKVRCRASVIIPTWNGAGLLEEALRSLGRQTFREFEIIVVDNGSSDGTAAMLERDFPHALLIRFEVNRGFAAAVNMGIRSAAGDVVVLMNNDVEADPGWLAALVETLDRNPEVGSCASRMLVHAEPSRIDSVGDRFGFFAYSIGHGATDGPDFDDPREVLSACAGAAAYRREALEEVGLFDERFFAYLEDIDLGIRLQLRGWRCRYVQGAVAFHHGSATAQRMPQLKLYLLMRNSLALFFQYMPVRTLVVWTPMMLAWPFYRAVRERQSPRLALRVLSSFVNDLPAIRKRRAAVGRTRRLSTAQFRARLGGWRAVG